jgi:RNA-splicing ligase RtcB
MEIIKTDKMHAPLKAWIPKCGTDEPTLEQMRKVCSLPFIFRHAALMPDGHLGKGSAIGAVVPTKGAIIPAVTGVDLGCGMMAVQTSLTANDLPDNLRKIRKAIEQAIPHGRTDHGGRRDKGAWGDIPKRQKGVWAQLEIGYKEICEKFPKLDRGNTINHLGTLGTGNHFIEVCLDESDSVWFMLHSGSRGVGNRIGTFFIEMAKSDMRRHIANLPDKDLAYFEEGSEHFDDYVHAVSWAQDFAMYNRKLMMEQMIDAIADSGEVKPFKAELQVVNCHHNYCIPASEIIPTPSGPKSIVEMKPGEEVYAFDPEQGITVAKVINWVASGKKRIYTISTDHREIRVSGDHPLLVIEVAMIAHPDRAWHLKSVGNYVWKQARDLKVGDILVCAKGYHSADSQSLGQEMSRFVGAFLGDGWIRQKTTSGYTVGLAIGSAEEEVTKRYATLLSERLFPKANWFSNVPGAFGLTCSSKAVYSTVKELELGQQSNDKYVPNYCFSLPLEERKALLAGYLDADGCITSGGARVSSSSRRLTIGLRELALSCGFSCTNVHFTTRRSNFGNNPLYNFYIGSASLSKLELWHEGKRARQSPPTKSSNGLQSKKLGYLSLPHNIFAERIREIQISEQVEAVYDIEVDSPNHSFICEGVVVHNCSRETHYGEEVLVTRKGAVRAALGDYGIIPGSMGARSYIVRGLGNEESFHSCSHGAGRAMSRNEARRRISLDDHIRDTAGVECRKDEDVIDESPRSYKDIEAVMNAQRDLVEVVHTLKQVVCVKG